MKSFACGIGALGICFLGLTTSFCLLLPGTIFENAIPPLSGIEDESGDANRTGRRCFGFIGIHDSNMVSLSRQLWPGCRSLMVCVVSAKDNRVVGQK